MKCKDCEHFKILCEPMMPWELGVAQRDNYGMVTEFIDYRKINRLTCIEVEQEVEQE